MWNSCSCPEKSVAGAGEEPTRDGAYDGKREGSADSEERHDHRHLAEILPLAREQRGCAERRPDTGRPDQAKQKSNDQLAAESLDTKTL
jgi:hypothetical protein